MSVRNVSRALIASPFFSAGGFPSTTDGFVERDQLERDVALRLCQRVLRREGRLLRLEHGQEVAGTWRERRAGRRGAGRLGAAGGRRAQELRRTEPDDSRPAELVGHLRRGRKGLRAEELVAEELADVPGRRAAAARSRYDIGRL